MSESESERVCVCVCEKERVCMSVKRLQKGREMEEHETD